MKNEMTPAELRIAREDAIFAQHSTSDLLRWAHSCPMWLAFVPEHWTREHLISCIRSHWMLDSDGMFWIERA